MEITSQQLKNFWDKVNKAKDCWNWMGGVNKNRGKYGRFRFDKKLYLAHRFSWILHFGEIKEGLYVCHKCDNPLCVNPEHLFLGTQKDNMSDMKQKNRNFDFSGENNNKCSITENMARQIKQISIREKSIAKVAKMFNVSINIVNKIKHNRTWKHINLSAHAVQRYN